MGAKILIDVNPFEECVCCKMPNNYDLCQDILTFSEKGKKVRLVIRPGEEAKALVLDGCVFKDNKLKCDGLFLFQKGNKKFALLVELKGAHNIAHAFQQLAYVQKSRKEYLQLVDRFQRDGVGKLTEKAFIVSNGQLTKTEQESLENQYGIRVTSVLLCEATSPIPDLSKYLK